MPEKPWSSGDMLAELESLRRRVADLESVRNESKRVSFAMEDLESRYHALYEQGPMFCMVVGVDGVLREANAAAAGCLGYAPDELAGRKFLSLIEPDKDGSVHDRLTNALTGTISGEVEAVMRGKDRALHRVLFLSALPVHDKHARRNGALLVGQDVTDQRHAEAALRAGDRQYQALIEGVPEPIFSLDTEQRFVFANWSTAELLETKPRALIGRSFREFVSDDGWKLVLDRTAELRHGTVKPYDLKVIRPDGSTRNVSAKAALRHDAAGNPIGLVVALGKVGKHETVERALEESESRYRSLFEESIDVIYITSKDGKLVDISPSAVSLFGYAREELLEHNVHGLYVDPDQRVRFQEAIERQGFVEGFEIRLRRKDGRAVDCLLASSVRKGADGEILGYQGIMRDITDRKRAEEARERERRTFRVIAEAAVRAPDLSDLCGRVLNGLVDVLGFDGGTIRLHDGKKGILHPVAVTGIPDDARHLIESLSIQTNQECTAAHVARTGEPLFAPDVAAHDVSDTHGDRLEALDIRSLISYPVVGAQQNLLAILQLFAKEPRQIHEEDERLFFETVAGMLAAVIERMLAENQTRSVEAQLIQAQKMEAVGTLASGVAHDFNNLLTAIQGFAELTLMTVDEDSGIREDLEKIRMAADRGAGLVRQLLLFGREHPVELSAVNINNTTQGMVKMVAPLIGADVSVKTALEPDLWTALADEGSLQQVLMNLAVNARDAMPEGGTLTIRTRNVTIEESEARKGAEERAGNFVCVSVEDSGSGMDEDTMGRIFEPFFSTKGPGKGTGLGLSVVYGIVKQHDGWIYTLSTPRRGTTFEVYLPATTAEPASAPALTETAPRRTDGGERILVVEDEHSVRELAATVLRKHGYVVFEAGNVNEALRIFNEEEGRFDLVFSDVVLPDRSGVQLADQLLRDNPRLRMLMSSGHASHRSQWDTIKEKGLPFIPKPYSLPGLLKAVRDTIGEEQ